MKTAYNLLDEAAKRLLQKKDGEVTNEDLLNAIEKVEKATKRVGAKPIVTFFEVSLKILHFRQSNSLSENHLAEFLNSF